ncbi:MAG: hypothetical protein PHO01_05655 [Desulfotomaculaceae bacterium]|nr:hypothetical protein [Desulfotomaculaceae bacterium]
MRMISAVAAGFIINLFLYLLVYLAVPQAPIHAFWIGWALFSLLLYKRAKTYKMIWYRACLIAAVECLAIPPAAWLLPLFSQQTLPTAKQSAYLKGQEFWSIYGSQLVTLLSGSAGILIGLLLLFIAHYALKPARRK